MAHRSQRLAIRAAALLSTVGLVLGLGLVAQADSPNPNPSAGISGSAQRNADGTVTVTVSGSWVWKKSGTNCVAGWNAAWNDSFLPGNVIGKAGKGTTEVGVLNAGNGNAADNVVHHGAAGSCVSGPWGPMTHVYTAQQQSFTVCVVTYHVKSSNYIAGGPGHQTDNSFEENKDTFPPGSCATLTPDPVHGALTIAKSVNHVLVHVGDAVDYTYVVTNTGNVDLHDVAVTDDLLGSIGSVSGTLAPGGSATLHRGGVTITGQTSNVGTAVGKDPLGRAVGPVTDVAEVDVENPVITLAKGSDRPAYHVGDVITYTFDVTNHGDTTLSNVALTDATLGLTQNLSDLGPGATESSSATMTVPSNAADSITNNARVCGTDSLRRTVCATSAHKVLILKPGIKIVKSANPTSVEPGQTVTFTYTVTNEGNTPLTGAVTDDVLGTIGTLDGLAPGASQTFVKSMVAAADSPRTNIGTACGSDALGGRVCDSSKATISIVLGQLPSRAPAATPVVGTPHQTG